MLAAGLRQLVERHDGLLLDAVGRRELLDTIGASVIFFCEFTGLDVVGGVDYELHETSDGGRHGITITGKTDAGNVLVRVWDEFLRSEGIIV